MLWNLNQLIQASLHWILTTLLIQHLLMKVAIFILTSLASYTFLLPLLQYILLTLALPSLPIVWAFLPCYLPFLALPIYPIIQQKIIALLHQLPFPINLWTSLTGVGIRITAITIQQVIVPLINIKPRKVIIALFWPTEFAIESVISKFFLQCFHVLVLIDILENIRNPETFG